MSTSPNVFETTNGETFARQNTRTIEGLTVAGRIANEYVSIIDQYAEHHAGGAFVLYGETEAGLSVKMHDSWGDDHQVIVNIYSSTDDIMNGGLDMVQEWPVSQVHHAVQAFHHLLGHSPKSVTQRVAMGLWVNGVPITEDPMGSGIFIQVSDTEQWRTGWSGWDFAQRDRLVDGDWQPVEDDGENLEPVELVSAGEDCEDVDRIVVGWTNEYRRYRAEHDPETAKQIDEILDLLDGSPWD